MINIYTDGSGKGAYGYVIMSEDNLETLNSKYAQSETSITNNQAEYMGVLFALMNTNQDCTIISDSQLVVNQLNHEWAIKNDDLRKLAQEVWELCKNRKIEFKWVHREKNKAGKLLG